MKKPPSPSSANLRQKAEAKLKTKPAGSDLPLSGQKLVANAMNIRTRDLTFLNNVAIDLASIRTSHDLYVYIPATLKKFSGAAASTFSVYDSKSHAIQVKHAEMEKGIITDLLNSLGGKTLSQTRFPVSEDIRRSMINDPIVIKDSLSETTFGVVPPLIGKVVQKSQNIDRFIGIAYIVSGELYGTSVLGMKSHLPDPSLDILKTFANLVAISLQRIQVDEALAESERFHRSLFNMMSGFAYCRMIYENEKPLDFVYLIVNEAFELQTGLKDVCGRKVTEVIPGIRKTDPQLFEIYGRVANTGKSERFEIFIESLNRWFSVSVFSPSHEYFIAIFDVIDDRKKAAEKLLKSQLQLSSIYNTVGDVIYYLAIEAEEKYRFISVNQAFYKITGLSQEQVAGKLVNEVIPEPSLTMVLEKYKRAINENRTIRWEETSDYPNGRKIGEVSVTPVVDDNGVCRNLVGSVHDLTEHRLAEKALQESEERLVFYTLNSPMAIIEWDADFIVTRWSGDSEKIFGWSHEETVGKEIMSLNMIFEPDIPIVLDTMEKLSNGLSRQVISTNRNYRKDRSIIHCEWFNTVLRDNDGKMVSVMSQVLDITKRKLAEERLLFISKAIESVSDAIGISDAQGHHIYQNKALTELFGYATADEIEAAGGGAVVVNNAEVAKEMYGNIMMGKSWSGELDMVTKSGHVFRAYERADAIKDSEGNIAGLIGIITDMTDRKLIEVELADEKKRLLEILKGTDAGSWEWNIATGETILNEKWAEMIGYTLEEISPTSFETWMKLVHPDDKPASDDLLQKHFNGQLEYYDCEVRMKHKDGHWVWVLDRGRVHKWDHAGNPLLMSGTHQDITERKVAEVKLREGEERLNLFFSQSLDGFFFMMLDEPVVWNDAVDKEKTLNYVFDHQRVTKANKAILEQYGLTEEQFISYTPNDFFSHDINHGRQVWKDFFDNGQMHVDTREKKSDGSDMIIEGDYICLYDSEKRITGHFGIQRDVTAARRAEEELRKSEAQKNAILDGIKANIAFVDKDLKIIWVNKTAAESVGKPAQEMIGQTCHHFWANPTEPCNNCPSIKAMKTKKSERSIMHTPDGRIWDERGEPIFDKDGNVTGIVEIAADITTIRQTEEISRLNEEKFRKVFENSVVGKSLTTLDGKMNINKAFSQITGYTGEELAQMTWQEITHPEDVEKDQEVINSIISGEKNTEHWEKRYIHKNGNIIWVDISTALQKNEAGEPMFFITSVIDISGRKTAEEKNMSQLRELQRWQEITLGREDRNRQLKHEVNELLIRLGETIRYPSQEGLALPDKPQTAKDL